MTLEERAKYRIQCKSDGTLIDAENKTLADGRYIFVLVPEGIWHAANCHTRIAGAVIRHAYFLAGLPVGTTSFLWIRIIKSGKNQGHPLLNLWLSRICFC